MKVPYGQGEVRHASLVRLCSRRDVAFLSDSAALRQELQDKEQRLLDAIQDKEQKYQKLKQLQSVSIIDDDHADDEAHALHLLKRLNLLLLVLDCVQESPLLVVKPLPKRDIV